MSAETEEIIRASACWREIENAAAEKRIPQTVGIVAPTSVQPALSEMYGRLILGEEGLDGEGGHPDLIVLGAADTTPKIDDCRRLQSSLALKPVSSGRRFAVIWRSDRLEAPAANSLLRITEMPPEHGYILFMAEEDKLLPTIKSRIWLKHIELPKEMLDSRPMPVTMNEWADWMKTGQKSGSEILCADLQGWARELARAGDFLKASRLDSAVRVIEQRRLSVPVIQDMVFALFKEEVPYEKILGGLR